MKTFRRKVAPVGLLWCCTLLVFNFQPSTGTSRRVHRRNRPAVGCLPQLNSYKNCTEILQKIKIYYKRQQKGLF
ncbi:MAG: hypothetical protein LBG58_00535 [Planctomycetaceae bacterium]|nr:hypothetical protein [Planctomycetaceae bacterium]